MSENLSPVTAETSAAEDDDNNPKSKSKKRAIGAFIVENDSPKKTESIWGDAKKNESTDDSKTGLFGMRRGTEAKPAEAEPLEPEEHSEAIRRLAAARRTEVTDEPRPETETPLEQAEAAAVAAYLASAEELGDVEAAYAQTVADLEATEVELIPEEKLEEREIDTIEPHEGEIALHDAAEVEPSDTEDQPAATGAAVVTPAMTAGPPPRPPVGRGADSGSEGGFGGGNQPPTPPPGPPSSPGNIPPPIVAGVAANQAPLPAAARVGQTVPLSTALANERRAQTDGLIVGAVVGYLFGRRRGRIKTEKRLAPVQRKLEKQVKLLQTELQHKEDLVRQKVRSQAVAPILVALERVKLPEQRRTPAVVPPERIGHVLVAASEGAERRAEDSSSRSPERAPVQRISKVETASARKQAETMSRRELLVLSEKVVVDGTTLRQIYETQLVSEKGLRRLVTEHLRGGNVSRALRRELVERQIDFERDPILRDKWQPVSSEGTGKAALIALLANAGASPEAESQPIGYAEPNPKAPKKKVADKAKPRQQVLVDVALITLITILVMAITALLLRSN